MATVALLGGSSGEVLALFSAVSSSSSFALEMRTPLASFELEANSVINQTRASGAQVGKLNARSLC